MESNSLSNNPSGFVGNIYIKEEQILPDADLEQDRPTFLVRSIKSELNPQLNETGVQSSSQNRSNNTEHNAATTGPSFILSDNSFENEIMAQFAAANKRCKCDLCPKTFSDKYRLEFHKKKTHFGKFQCKQCHQLFWKKYELVIHLSDHIESPSSVLQQQLTSIANDDPENLKVDSGNEDGEKRKHDLSLANIHEHRSQEFECEKCKRKFSRLRLLRMHERRTHSEHVPYGCPICGKKFGSEPKLKKHSLSHVKEGPFQCKSCEGKFEHPFFLIMHQRTHSDAEKGIKQMILHCPKCSEKFYDPKILKEHLLKHLEEKPIESNAKVNEILSLVNDAKLMTDLGENQTPEFGYDDIKCFECGKMFSRFDSLRKHIRLHTGEYECEICKKRFVDKFYYQQHVNVHNGTKQFDCHICDKKFFWFESYKSHMVIHKDPCASTWKTKPTLECDQCGQKYHSLLTLNQHMESHSEATKYECALCNTQFKTRRYLAHHMRSHLEKDLPHKCSFCGKGFLNAYQVRYHERYHTGERPFECNLCPKKFCTKGALNDHLKKHRNEPPLKCSECKFASWNKSSLRSHIRIHTGEKPYKCDKCDKAFRLSHSLKLHSNIHTDVNPYECKICGKRFKRPTYLANHLVYHTGKRPHKCDLCKKRYRFKWQMNAHRKRHAGGTDALLKCDKCDKSFASGTGLRIHVRKHNGEKPYKCNECEEKFYTGSLLKIHMRSHTGEKPYTCKICSLSFRLKEVFNRHLKAHRQGKGFECLDCRKTFTMKKYLKNHWKEENHYPTGNNELVVSYQCANCEQKFSDVTSFEQHQVIHNIKKEEPED